MGLLYMSFSGAVIILVIVAIRMIAINRLPKKLFLVLWGTVLLRLLVPFSVPSEFSVYSLINKVIGRDLFENGYASSYGNEAESDYVNSYGSELENNIGKTGEKNLNYESDISINETKKSFNKITNEIPSVSIWSIIWFIGMIICGGFFVVSYFHCKFKFETSFPVENDFVRQWLETHKIRRRISIKQSDRIFSPLTYGVFHPVILMPKNTDWENINQLQYIFMHEYIHICHYDIIVKFISIIALCIHWFNPFAWLMYILINRDIELTCDESVIHKFGEKSNSTYADMLISMEIRKSGLMPLSNNFSKNAIEERIKAIMKIKKLSFFTVFISAAVVIFIMTVFVTSAANNARFSENDLEEEKIIADTDFSEEEYEKLLDLKFDGYENMSVSEYQYEVWKMTDTEEYMDLLERFSKDEKLYEMRDNDEIASFLFNILEPLTAQKWQTREFGGYAVSNYHNLADDAMFEFSFILNIRNADELTVYEYNNTRLEIKDELENILQNKSQDELKDEELMNDILSEEVNNIVEKWSSDRLEVEIAYSFIPAADYDESTLEYINEEYEKNIEPYLSFGLTYEYDSAVNVNRMYYNGKEVRGIYDEVKGICISEVEGIGEGIYDYDVIELYAVYEGDKLVGLREADADEQSYWDRKRQQITDEWKKESRRYPNGTKEDYDSLLKLKTPDCKNMSIKDFNMDLLEWSNENYERMERINVDMSFDNYDVSLTNDELSFIKLTVYLSGMENGKYVQGNYTGRPEEDVICDRYLPEKIIEKNGLSAWCDLYYQFSYHIKNKETLTVGERDSIIENMMNDIEEFWNETSIEDMLKMSEEDVVRKLGEIAKKNSNNGIVFTIRDDYVSFDSMDERNIED